jgi:hypothetical protein
MKILKEQFYGRNLITAAACIFLAQYALLYSTGNGSGGNSSDNSSERKDTSPVVLGRLDSLSGKLNIVLATKDFNGDGRRDTLKAEFVQENVYTAPYRARLIAWGRERDSVGNPKGTARFTEFIYPGYYIGGIRTPVSVTRYNQDTLPDILFTIRGKVKKGQDTLEAMTTIAVFGQSQLYSQSMIILGDIKNHQKKPFQAIVLAENTHLKHKGKRDLSGNTSYELPRINLSTSDTSSAEERKDGERTIAGKLNMNIYPNPAIYTTNLTASKVPAGSYRVRIVASDGREVVSSTIRLETEGDIIRSIDVSQLPTGFYMMLVSRDSQFLGSYPVIVSH